MLQDVSKMGNMFINSSCYVNYKNNTYFYK